MSLYQAQEKYRNKLKAEVLQAYGNECVKCGMKDTRYLTIDHINGLSPDEDMNKRSGYRFYLRLRRDKFPPGFQVLCYACNIRKQ